MLSTWFMMLTIACAPGQPEALPPETPPAPTPSEEQAAAGAATPAGPVTVELKEWPVPWPPGRPRDPFVAPDGRVWFVGQAGNYVGVFTPETEQYKQLPLPKGVGPHNLVVDGQGRIWYAGNLDATIGRMDPETGEIHRIPMPDGPRDPHTLAFAPDGRTLWFTAQHGNFIGRMDTETEQVQIVEAPVAHARPYGIVVAPDGRPWINLFGTNLLATVDPQTMALETVAVPREEARTRRIGLTSDGAVWYVDHQAGYVGRYDPVAKDFREWRTPGGEASRPYAMAVDDRDRVWFVETGAQPNVLVGFDPATETFSRTEIPSGGGAVRHMVFHEGALWFGTDNNTLGRARIVVADGPT